MSILVIAEHDGAELKPGTLNTVSAAAQIGGEIHVLVAGSGCAAVAEAAAKIDGVTKVLNADAAEYGKSSSSCRHCSLSVAGASASCRRRV